MRPIVAALITTSLIATGCSATEPDSDVPDWAVGYWVQVQDEDGQPGDDTFELRRDGSVIVYDAKCGEFPPGRVHVFNGLLYATHAASKGPISMVFAPSADHRQLTFTSPRTGNNAVYERTVGCHPVEG